MQKEAAAPQSSPAEIVREYGPFPNAGDVHGVTFDGENVWFAAGTHLQAFDPVSGQATARLDVPGRAGSAFDGRHLYQIVGGQIHKLELKSGKLVAKLPLPVPADDCSGLTWAEGKLWLGQYRARKLHQIDASSGKLLRSLEAARFVTGVTWHDDELWYGTWEDDVCDLRRVNSDSGEVLERLTLPEGMKVSGLESDRRDGFYCGGATSGKVRAVRRAKR
ncbi:MAG: glutamine cyclotransferase [Myxococcota bacterium]